MINQQAPRRLPDWAWALAVLLFYPGGVFIAFGFARLLAWRWAVTLAVLSGLCTIGFVMLMEHLEHCGAAPLYRVGANLGGVLVLAGWTFLIYYVGQRVEYWTPKVKRGWLWAGCLLFLMVLFNAVAVGFILTVWVSGL